MTYKIFEAGETLSANDVMTYFMNQVVTQEATYGDLALLPADIKVAYVEADDTVYAKVAGTWEPLAYEGGDFTFDDLTVNGNLTVNGTTTNINTTNLVVEDKNIILADVASPTDVTADGAGITIKGTTDKTLNWVDATDAFTSSEHINLASGKTIYKNGTDLKDVSETLTNKTLNGSNNTITNVSLTAGVTGTLPVGNGGTGLTTYTQGQIPYASASNVLSALTIGSSGQYLKANSSGIPEWANLPAGYSLPSQTGNSGKFLTTNGTTESWGTVAQYSLPSQTGNTGKLLTTNGTTESWSSLTLDEIQIIKVMDYL